MYTIISLLFYASPTQWHEFEQTPEDGEGQGSLVHCSPCCRKDWDTTEWLNNKHINIEIYLKFEIEKEYEHETKSAPNCSYITRIEFKKNEQLAILWSFKIQLLQT